MAGGKSRKTGRVSAGFIDKLKSLKEKHKFLEQSKETKVKKNKKVRKGLVN